MAQVTSVARHLSRIYDWNTTQKTMVQKQGTVEGKVIEKYSWVHLKSMNGEYIQVLLEIALGAHFAKHIKINIQDHDQDVSKFHWK